MNISNPIIKIAISGALIAVAVDYFLKPTISKSL